MPGHRKFSELRRKAQEGYASSGRQARDLAAPPPGPASGARPRNLPEPDKVWAWGDPGEAADVATALRLLGVSAYAGDAGWGTGEYVVQIRLNKALADALGLDIQERP